MPLGADALTFGCPRPLPKESVLSRRHRAPATASPGSARLAAARAALERSRARIVLVLAAPCAGLLIAAPIALLVSGRVDGGGTSHDSDRVFAGEPGPGADSGPGSAATGIATQSAAAPSPGVPSVDGGSSAGSGPAGPAAAGTAVGGGTTGGVVAGGGSGVSGGGNGASGGGTAAGAPAPGGG